MKSWTRTLGPLLIVLAVATALWLRPRIEPQGPERGKRAVELLIQRARLLNGRLANIVIDQGVIVGVGYTPTFGSRYEVRRVIDAGGATLIGGVHDHHAHMFLGGTGLDTLQLGRFETLDELYGGIRRWAEAHPDLPWIRGRGWLYSMFPGGLPTRRQLDEVIADRPVILKAFDGHAQWANSVALERAGITAETRDPPEGNIVRDKTGEPTGVFLETAQTLVERAAPAYETDEELEVLRAAARHVLRRGVTVIDDMVSRDIAERVRLYRRLHDEGSLNVRVRMFSIVTSTVSEDELDAIVELRDGLHNHPRLELAGIKIFVDGVIESKTAYLLEPYATFPARGAPRLSPDRLQQLLRAAGDRGLAVAMHTIGDGAVRMALDQIEVLSRDERPSLLRLEHVEIVAPEDRARLVRLGVEASMQPLHADPGGPNPEDGVWARNLGASRMPLTFPWRSLLEAGVVLRFGSDWPVVDCDPLPGIAVALTRQSAEGLPSDGWVPAQRIPLEPILKAYGAEADLELGSSANLVVLDPGVRFSDVKTLWRSTYGQPPAVRAVIAHGEIHDFSAAR